MSNVNQLWDACAQSIRDQVSDGVWNSTFKEARPLSVTNDELVLTVPSQWVKDRVEGPFKPLVAEALHEASPTHVNLIVEVDTKNSDALDLSVVDDIPLIPEENQENTYLPAETHNEIKSEHITNEKYTFDSFVTGTSNRFAHAAALSVAERPAQSYNPLFIHGEAGLGKTHLLQAIENYIHENYPSHSTRYVSTETFLNEFIEAIRTNNRAEFKSRYREIDVLLMDDIQFLEGKEGLQEEFFHTFNSLHQANKQIVLSSDRPPDAISTLEDRLRSRFKMGLLTDIQPPDLETRLAILRKKAEFETFPVPDEVLEFIATHATENIRELEGALIRVCAFANLSSLPLTVDLAKEVLHELIALKKPRPITPNVILDTTAEMFGLSKEDIIGQRRHRPLVTARQIAMYVFRELTELSYPAIAREFGGRDHTTVIHAVDKISGLMSAKQTIYDQVTELIHTIKTGK
ncbi:MAG: chromosomal replication initiator protein DnaA [Acidimicrobiales bacterium]